MNRTPLLDIAEVQTELAASGLNLFETFAVADLTDSVPDLELSGSWRHLLLVGSAGADLWSAMPSQYFTRSNPVDEYSVDCIENCLGNHLPPGKWSILFPEARENSRSANIVPLQKLGAEAGWHHASPLGIGINATHGLWFAYRAVVAIDADVIGSSERRKESESPCLSCETKPCLSHCPAGALAITRQPDLNACVKHRTAEQSSCASTCLARLACPVGTAFKYPEQQTAYFYNRSLASAKRWIDNND